MVSIDSTLVRRLVDSQFPAWAGLALRAVERGGSDHVIHRLGESLAVRLPRHSGAIGQAAKEFTSLPRLAPFLPLAIPSVVAVGEPDFGYPWPWAVSRWLPGSVATVAEFGSSVPAAVALSSFLRALQTTPVGSFLPDKSELSVRDSSVRGFIDAVSDVFDPAAMTRVWDDALAAPAWDRAPVWFHGDFHTGNVLAAEGRITAVIDFGGLGVGDPARDMMMAFTLLDDTARAAFRASLGVDDATWARGRGWALAAGLNAYVSYAAVDARVAAQTTRQIAYAITPAS